MSPHERLSMKGSKKLVSGVKNFDSESSKSQLQFAPKIITKALKLAEIAQFKIHVEEMPFLDTMVEKNDAL